MIAVSVKVEGIMEAKDESFDFDFEGLYTKIAPLLGSVGGICVITKIFFP